MRVQVAFVYTMQADTSVSHPIKFLIDASNVWVIIRDYLFYQEDYKRVTREGEQELLNKAEETNFAIGDIYGRVITEVEM